MTSENDYSRLIDLYNKVVFIGDSFQLAPVEGDEWFQKAEPDVVLNQIVRTAQNSEVTQVASLIRKQNPEWKKNDWHNEVTIIPRINCTQIGEAMNNADIVLAHKNDTCNNINWLIRDLRGLIGDDPFKPQPGEPLLSWESQKDLGLIRSEVYEVVKSFPISAGYRVNLKGMRKEYFDINRANLKNQKTDIVVKDMLKFSYAHCITGHKNQGSEWDNVVVLAYDHAVKFTDHWSWFYTICTRAKTHLTIVI